MVQKSVTCIVPILYRIYLCQKKIFSVSTKEAEGRLLVCPDRLSFPLSTQRIIPRHNNEDLVASLHTITTQISLHISIVDKTANGNRKQLLGETRDLVCVKS
jgi:hypothetical protein